jgi:hypothetical protein
MGKAQGYISRARKYIDRLPGALGMLEINLGEKAGNLPGGHFYIAGAENYIAEASRKPPGALPYIILRRFYIESVSGTSAEESPKWRARVPELEPRRGNARGGLGGVGDVRDG